MIMVVLLYYFYLTKQLLLFIQDHVYQFYLHFDVVLLIRLMDKQVSPIIFFLFIFYH